MGHIFSYENEQLYQPFSKYFLKVKLLSRESSKEKHDPTHHETENVTFNILPHGCNTCHHDFEAHQHDRWQHHRAMWH